MSKSNDYLYRCLDIMKSDPNLSEETKIIMFITHSKLVVEESKSSDWYSVKEHRPNENGVYEVYRAGTKKQHYEVWNNTGWEYHNNYITHWREIKAPKTNKY